MKKVLAVCCSIVFASIMIYASGIQRQVVGKPVVFESIYGFLPGTHLSRFSKETTASTIGYFAVDVDTYGDLGKVPARSDVAAKYKGNIELVAVCNNSTSLAHFVLSPEYDKRDKLIADLIAASKDYDGLMIDYELIPNRDGLHFLTFLKELKSRLPAHKSFGVCVKARVRTLANDTLPYKPIADIADKVVIMAYDEHWSGGQPGSVASMEWCKRIAEYAKTQIPIDKLVMGLPFYGREWCVPDMSRAVRYETAKTDLKEAGIHSVERDDDIPYASFSKTVDVMLWYEDCVSVVSRCRMYHDMGIKHIAFWCLGQEDTDIWNWVKVSP